MFYLAKMTDFFICCFFLFFAYLCQKYLCQCLPCILMREAPTLSMCRHTNEGNPSIEHVKMLHWVCADMLMREIQWLIWLNVLKIQTQQTVFTLISEITDQKTSLHSVVRYYWFTKKTWSHKIIIFFQSVQKRPCLKRFGPFHNDLSLLIWFWDRQIPTFWADVLCKEVFYVQIRN